MQIVGLSLCIVAALLGCVLAFVRRRGKHQVPAFIMDVVVTCIVLAAFVTGILGCRSMETEVREDDSVQKEIHIPDKLEVNVEVK